MSDENPDHLAQVKRLIADIRPPRSFDFVYVNRKSSAAFEVALQALEKANRWIPTFAFLDPFGYKDIHYSQIARLLARPSCEAFITVMIDRLCQFTGWENPSHRQTIREYFGTDEVFKIHSASSNKQLDLRMLFQRQLELKAKFVQYFEMINKNNKTLYYLFFASNHQRGNERMNEAMWKIDRAGTFRFSDRSDPNVSFMFDPDDIVRDTICHMVRERLSGEQVSTDEFYDQLIEGRYLESHGRAALKQLETEGKVLVSAEKSDGKKRVGKSLPRGLTITFV